MGVWYLHSCEGLEPRSQYLRAVHFLNFRHFFEGFIAFSYMRLNANSGCVSVPSSAPPVQPVCPPAEGLRATQGAPGATAAFCST